MFAVALDPIQQKLGAECPFPAKMVDWAQNKVVINNTNILNIIIMKISTWIYQGMSKKAVLIRTKS